MKLIFSNHSFVYEIEKLSAVFLPNVRFENAFQDEKIENEDYIFTRISEHNDICSLEASVCLYGKCKTVEGTLPVASAEDERERALAVCLYEALSFLTGYKAEWGILTGVRPAKLMSRLVEKDGEANAQAYFKNSLLVSEDKTQLAATVARAEDRIVRESKPDSFSLYVSIPFCPTRCSYCSFVSHSNMSAKKLIPQYVDLLCSEIEFCAQQAKELGLRLESIYYGGGTPTVLEPDLLEKVMHAVNSNFNLEHLREYTVEAGRPDSITPEKLAVIKKYGTTRISINPQTFEDEVLVEIGRKHTGAQTLEAFKLAREAGFTNINMDLIAGLPKDSVDGFNRTLETTLSLSPESITVHTLALKRSSEIVTAGRDYNDALTVKAMLESVQNQLPEHAYKPYYMYRQSKTVGNMENVGWAKEGFESLYNVYMMEECHTVIGVGSAAVTKLKAPFSNLIERVFNFKYPYEYINRFDELLERKQYINQFYYDNPTTL